MVLLDVVAAGVCVAYRRQPPLAMSRDLCNPSPSFGGRLSTFPCTTPWWESVTSKSENNLEDVAAKTRISRSSRQPNDNSENCLRGDLRSVELPTIQNAAHGHSKTIV